MKSNIWIIKLGGQFLLNITWVDSLMKALKIIIDQKNAVVIVHGGGPQADEVQNKLKIPIKKINGRRITDKATLEAVKMVYAGSINTDLVAIAVKFQVQAVGLTGADAKLAEVVKRPLKKIMNYKTGKFESIDFGYVGDIKTVNNELLECLLAKNFVPVLASLGVDNQGHILNINADSLATAIACSLCAERLIFISDVKGIAAKRV